MKRFTILIICFTWTAESLIAQSMEDGKRMFYYERYQSAKQILSQVVAADPANAEAVYWLGQVLIQLKDSLGAKEQYAKALQLKGDALILFAGMGQIELMEGKKDQARQRFETALDLNKKKNDLAVFNAVALANIKPPQGDLTYAIEKLTAATQIKNFDQVEKDTAKLRLKREVYLLMGDAYRKMIDGSNAVSSYNKALAIDPKFAAAKHRIGKVYLSQNNREYYLPAFESAVEADPGYTPSYFELFYHWYFRDVNKAAVYLEKYIANADQGPDMEYLKTDFLYASGKFGESKEKAKVLITQYGKDVNPRMYRLVAYTSDTTGDLPGARAAMQQFLSVASADDILSSDYEEMAIIYSKMAGQEQEAYRFLDLAVSKDTLLENKVKYINKAVSIAKKLGNRQQESYWLGIAYKIKKKPGQGDLYNWGYANYTAANYQLADSIFCNMYQSAYPSEIYGYLWCARSKQALDDSVNSKGLAVEAYKILAEKARQFDPVKFKNMSVNAYLYLIQYYNDIAKDKPTAIAYCDSILKVDTANASAKQIKDMLIKASGKPTAPPSKKQTPPSGGGGAALLPRNKAEGRA